MSDVFRYRDLRPSEGRAFIRIMDILMRQPHLKELCDVKLVVTKLNSSVDIVAALMGIESAVTTAAFLKLQAVGDDKYSYFIAFDSFSLDTVDGAQMLQIFLHELGHSAQACVLKEDMQATTVDQDNDKRKYFTSNEEVTAEAYRKHFCEILGMHFKYMPGVAERYPEMIPLIEAREKEIKAHHRRMTFN